MLKQKIEYTIKMLYIGRVFTGNPLNLLFNPALIIPEVVGVI